MSVFDDLEPGQELARNENVDMGGRLLPPTVVVEECSQAGGFAGVRDPDRPGKQLLALPQAVIEGFYRKASGPT